MRIKMRIAQITDCHVTRPGKLLYGALDTAAYLARAVAALNALDPAPDLVMLTGDLVDAGSTEEYARLRLLLEPLAAPYLLLPGNHDSREAMRAAFPEHAYLAGHDGHVDYVMEENPIRLIALDSVAAGEVWGRLHPQQLRWLDRTLAAAPERPTMIFVHHPPFATGVAHMDAHPFEGADRFAAVLRRHPQVERLAAGHVHRAMQTRWAGVAATTCPSTAHQFALDLRAAAPAAYTLEPPGFQLHCRTPDGGIVTHTAAIGEYPAARLG
jgi:3',5'-cyclic AMP phosphodiesterase CpdA